MYQLIFYVPEKNCEDLKSAVFSAGAGKYNNYSHCCWQTEGRGQFRPDSGSDPFIGEKGKIEYVREIKVEMIVQGKYLKNVINILKSTHPYEEPAYSITRLEKF